MSVSVAGLSSLSNYASEAQTPIAQRFALAAESAAVDDTVTLSSALLQAGAENSAAISNAVAASVQTTINFFA